MKSERFPKSHKSLFHDLYFSRFFGVYIFLAISFGITTVIFSGEVKAEQPGDKGKNKIVDETKTEIQKVDQKTRIANCPAGIGASEGDEPFLSWKLDDGSKIIFCGYPGEKTKGVIFTSEYEIFHVPSIKLLVRFGALDDTKIEQKHDSIQVDQIVHLPTGKNWSLELHPRYRYVINRRLEIDHFDEKYVFIPPVWSQRKIDEALAICRKQISQHDLEQIIRILAMAAFNGSEEAAKLFREIQNQVDGAIAEDYTETRDLYKEYQKKSAKKLPDL